MVIPLLQIKVYGAVAPLGVIFILPLFNPQLAFVSVEDIVTAEEAVTVMDDVAVQFTALVTVIVYVPAVSAEISSLVDPLLQLKV